jgi:hypothetical protein
VSDGRIFCETLSKEYIGLLLRGVRQSHSSHRRKKLKTFLGVHPTLSRQLYGTKDLCVQRVLRYANLVPIIY